MLRGDRIRELRRRSGMTQIELSEAVGITQGFLSQIEGGGRDVSTKTLVGLATILGTTPNYLLGLDESEGEPEPAALAIA